MKKQVSKYRTGIERTGWLWLAGSFLCLWPTTMVSAQTTNGQPLQRCGTAEYEQQVLQRRNPDRSRQIDGLNQRIGQFVRQQASNPASARQQATTIYRIPIVVHIVHSTASGAVGGTGNANVTDEQIMSQIPVLNEDYRRQPGTNGYNTNPIGADAGIEFFLATTDPNGNPTNGITRHYYPQKTSFDVFSDDVLLSQIAYWPSDRYLNVWLAPLQNKYLGYTQFPILADTLLGPPGDQNEFTDGTIIDYRYFGRQTGAVTSATYLLGRTATHEIGHWLGLVHTWGDGDCADDYVGDTPPTHGPNQTTQCKQTYSTCVAGKPQTRDLIEDYMDYSPDACMNLFTKGQVDRMRAVLQLSPRRARVVQAVDPPADADMLTIQLYPNPATSSSTVEVRLKGLASFTVDLFDMGGRQLRSVAYTNSPSTRITLPVTGLSTGLYIVRVKTATETASKRLLVH